MERVINWVEKRSTCNGASMFEKIKAGVQADVDERNKQMQGRGVRFEFRNRGIDSCQVMRLQHGGARTLTFKVSGNVITATEGDKQIASAIVELAAGSADCLLRMAEYRIPVEEWHFRFRASDALFFSAHDDDNV